MPLKSLSFAAWDCEFKLNFGTFFVGGGLEDEKAVFFLIVLQNEQS